MSVGYELAKLTGLKLFHNHMTIDLVLNFFDFGAPECNLKIETISLSAQDAARRIAETFGFASPNSRPKC
jgi:hypothetical protein